MLTKEQAIETLTARPIFNVDFLRAKDSLNRLFERAFEDEVKRPFFWGRGGYTNEEITDLHYSSWALHLVPSLQKKVAKAKTYDPIITAMTLFLNDWEDASALVKAAKKDVIKGRKPVADSDRKTPVRTIENTGTCPCCGKNVKLSGGRMVDHGFTLNYGWRNGNCFGVNEQPWEVSKEGRVNFITVLIAHRAKIAESLTPRSANTFSTRDDEDILQKIEWITKDIAYHQALVDGWKAQPLPGTK